MNGCANVSIYNKEKDIRDNRDIRDKRGDIRDIRF
jgi:hypothetical protein